MWCSFERAFLAFRHDYIILQTIGGLFNKKSFLRSWFFIFFGKWVDVSWGTLTISCSLYPLPVLFNVCPPLVMPVLWHNYYLPWGVREFKLMHIPGTPGETLFYSHICLEKREKDDQRWTTTWLLSVIKCVTLNSFNSLSGPSVIGKLNRL